MTLRKMLACIAVLAVATLWAAEKLETVTFEITGMT